MNASTSLYKFSQSLKCLTLARKVRIVFFLDRGGTIEHACELSNGTLGTNNFDTYSTYGFL